MLREMGKYGNLPRLQKKIVLALAKYGVMNISQTNKKIGGHESATNLAFHKLATKGIIQKVETYTYRGRCFSKYWLSDRGTALALISGVNPEKVEGTAVRLGRDKTYFDLRSASPKIAGLLDISVLLGDTVKPEEMFSRFSVELIAIDENEALDFLKAVKKAGKYDAMIEGTKEKMKKLMVRLQKFTEELEKI